MNGEKGNDRLVSGTGNDNMTGSLGYDIFVIGDGSGRDRIRDFKDGVDKLELLNGVQFKDLQLRQSGRDVLLQIAGRSSDSVLISNVTTKLITAADLV